MADRGPRPPASATRAGPRTGASTRLNAHPHFDTTDRVHVVVNGIVENYLALKRAPHRPGRACSPRRPTPRSSPTSSPTTWPRATCVEAVRAAYAELEGHFAFVAMSARRARRPRRRPQGVPADHRPRRGRDVPRLRDPRLPGAHPPASSTSRTARSSSSRPDGATVPDADGDEPSSATVVEIDWDEETAEKGGFETFMLKEIHEQADAVAETIADRTVRARRRRPRRRGALDERAAARRQAHRRRRLRHVLPRRPDRPLRDRGVGARPGRDGHRLRVPLPQPGRRPRRPRHRHHAVGRDRRHAGRDAPGARARRDGARRSPT